MKRHLVVSLLAFACGHAGAVTLLLADYQFANNLDSSVGTPPALTTVGSGTAFATETVFGKTQTVLTFTAGSGLSLGQTNNILPGSGVYTIALQARIHNMSPDNYSKLIDFSNGASDKGLYTYLGILDFYSYSGGSATPVIKLAYGDIVLTRDGSNMLAGYYNGSRQFSLDDSTNSWGVISVANTLRFFLDDSVGTGLEASPGAVARIRIWNTALSAAEVAQLTDPIFVDGFDG